jgi:hypothetical protein
VSKLASLSIRAASVIPETVALLLLVGISLLSHQLVTTVGESALGPVSTETLDLEGPAELSLVFEGRWAAVAVTGGLAVGAGRWLGGIEVLVHELIHVISIYLNDIIGQLNQSDDLKSVENDGSQKGSIIKSIIVK